MSAEAAVAVRSWSAGAYTCELTVQRPEPGKVVNAVIEWSPTAPARLTAAEWDEYRAGRHQALQELAAELQLSIGVLEL